MLDKEERYKPTMLKQNLLFIYIDYFDKDKDSNVEKSVSLPFNL